MGTNKNTWPIPRRDASASGYVYIPPRLKRFILIQVDGLSICPWYILEFESTIVQCTCQYFGLMDIITNYLLQRPRPKHYEA